MSKGGRALGVKGCRLSSRGPRAVLLLSGCTSAKAAGPVIVTHHLCNKQALSQTRASLDRATVSEAPCHTAQYVQAMVCSLKTSTSPALFQQALHNAKLCADAAMQLWQSEVRSIQQVEKTVEDCVAKLMLSAHASSMSCTHVEASHIACSPQIQDCQR